MKRGGFRILLTAVALGALVASPADAAKSKKKKPKAVPVTVATASASTSADNEPVSATATCPPGKIAVGGGFSSPPVFAGTMPTDINFVYESLRASATSWRASAVREDVGGAGPALALTSLAYCRTPKLNSKAGKKKAGASKKKKKKKKKLAITEVTAVSPPAAIGSTATATATCPGKLTPLGGGFSSSPPPVLSGTGSFAAFFLDLRSAPNAWTASALNFGGGAVSRTVTSAAYCAAPGSSEVAGSAVGPGATGSSAVVANATSTACPKGRSLVGGGFSHSTPGATGPFPVLTESQATGGSWVAGALNIGPGAASLGSRGYCL